MCVLSCKSRKPPPSTPPSLQCSFFPLLAHFLLYLHTPTHTTKTGSSRNGSSTSIGRGSGSVTRSTNHDSRSLGKPKPARKESKRTRSHRSHPSPAPFPSSKKSFESPVYFLVTLIKHPFVTTMRGQANDFDFEQELRYQSPPHGLTPDEWALMNAAAQEGDLEMLSEAVGRKNDGFWAQAEGRKALRFVATLACTQKRRRIVSHLVLKHNVPLNSVMVDELALDKGYPRRQKNNEGMKPLFASILSENEDHALFVLSLRPEDDLELGCRNGHPNNTLLYAFSERMPRVLGALLRRPTTPLFPVFGPPGDQHTFTCMVALACDPNMIRSVFIVSGERCTRHSNAPVETSTACTASLCCTISSL